MLKRLWDTENKKIVWLRDGKKAYQVFTDGDKLYVYHAGQRMEYNPSTSEAPAEEYWPTWAELEDQEVGYYDTNVPTNMYNWDEGEEVAYAFKNWSTTLQSWKVDEWETPEYTGDTPTKAADAQYTYTFSGWKPTVWPIYKKTDFKAQFTATPLPTLLTYDELVALGTKDAITTELNKAPTDYYNSLNAGGHIMIATNQELGSSVWAIVESLWDNPPTTVTPFIVDEGWMVYLIEWEIPWLTLHEWAWTNSL